MKGNPGGLEGNPSHVNLSLGSGGEKWSNVQQSSILFGRIWVSSPLTANSSGKFKHSLTGFLLTQSTEWKFSLYFNYLIFSFLNPILSYLVLNRCRFSHE